MGIRAEFRGCAAHLSRHVRAPSEPRARKRASVHQEQLQHLARIPRLEKSIWRMDGWGFGLGFWESCHAPYALGSETLALAGARNPKP